VNFQFQEICEVLVVSQKSQENYTFVGKIFWNPTFYLHVALRKGLEADVLDATFILEQIAPVWKLLV